MVTFERQRLRPVSEAHVVVLFPNLHRSPVTHDRLGQRRPGGVTPGVTPEADLVHLPTLGARGPL